MAVECPALTARRARRHERGGAVADPLVWHAAQGCRVRDVEGRVYWDWTSAFGVAAVGHGHPAVTEAVKAQTDTLLQALGDLHPADRKIELLERLAALAPFEETRGILGLSGSDAVTAALKTAVLVTGKPGVLAFEGAYHGLAHGPLSVCGYEPAFRTPFAEQLNPHVCFAPWPQEDDTPLSALERVAETWDRSGTRIGAVLLEPIQGRGGVRLPPEGFLSGLAALVRERGALLVADEILTGLGRTGTWWRSVAEGIRPDVLCVGKALGGGLPISACLAPASVMAAWGEPGREALHTGTFFGNPLGCAAALATLRTIQSERLVERAAAEGHWLLERLRQIAAEHGLLARGVGLLLALDGRHPGVGLRLHAALRARGHLTLPAASDASVLQILPPLTVPREASEALLGALRDALPDVLRETSP